MVSVIFNYDGNIQEVKEQFNIDFAEVSEMIEGTYMCALHNADDFDVMDDFMAERGKIEVISGWGKNGKQYKAKKEKNKYSKTKYKKYLKEKIKYDAEGNKIKKTKEEKDKEAQEVWQVNNYLGWADREL
jgi:hypothetical protein